MKNEWYEIYGKIEPEIQLSIQRAFDAMLSYEKNCMEKYDRGNIPIPKGERMACFAMRYKTTVEEMKQQTIRVYSVLGLDKLGRKKQLTISNHVQRIFQAEAYRTGSSRP